jgi:tripartite ATP-independent transporter DctM subunit
MQPIDVAPYMFAGLVIFLLLGYPVAFSLAAIGFGFAFFGMSTGLLDATFLNTIPLRLFGVMSNELLLAIPFFTLMGAILERSRLAEDMLNGFGQLFGPVRGGLAYAVVFVGAILGAITGTVAASVIAMALIALPVMMRYGYNMRLATGVIAASGTITQLIPPALVLIVLADQLGRSVGDMYKGALGPSIVQVLLFCLDAGAARRGAHDAWARAGHPPCARYGSLPCAHFHRSGNHPARPCHPDGIGRYGSPRLASARLVQSPP